MSSPTSVYWDWHCLPCQSLKKELPQGLHPVWSVWRYCWRLINATRCSSPLPNITGKKAFPVVTSRACHHRHCHKLLSRQNKLYRTEERSQKNPTNGSIRERISFTWSYEKRITKYECFRRTVWMLFDPWPAFLVIFMLSS